MDEARLRALIPSGAGVNVATGVAVEMDEAGLRALILSTSYVYDLIQQL